MYMGDSTMYTLAHDMHTTCTLPAASAANTQVYSDSQDQLLHYKSNYNEQVSDGMFTVANDCRLSINTLRRYYDTGTGSSAHTF